MNKTTLESLEEALERLEQIDGMYSWAHLLYEVREALAEQELYEPEGRCKECLAYNGHLDYCSKSAPVKRPQNCGTGYCSCIECPYEAEQAEQEPLMDYERINALREGEQNGAEDAYFFVRPENDTPSLRKMFCQGFERGFHKGLKYAAPVEPVKQEPVAWAYIDADGSFMDALDRQHGAYQTPLYAAPVSAKREWVDLTDDEIDLIEQQVYCRTTQKGRPLGVYAVELVRAVITAFKEKNT